MTTPPLFQFPPEPEYPTITLRSALPGNGAISVVLSPARPHVQLDGFHLEPDDARALGMTVGSIRSAHHQGIALPATATAETSTFVGATVHDDETISLHLGDENEHRELWRGPLLDAQDIAIALLGAAAASIAIERYADRPLFIVSPIDDGRNPFSPGVSGPH